MVIHYFLFTSYLLNTSYFQAADILSRNVFQQKNWISLSHKMLACIYQKYLQKMVHNTVCVLRTLLQSYSGLNWKKIVQRILQSVWQNYVRITSKACNQWKQ